MLIDVKTLDECKPNCEHFEIEQYSPHYEGEKLYRCKYVDICQNIRRNLEMWLKEKLEANND